MKILLAMPEQNPKSIDVNNVVFIEPLALEYIGAGVKDEHEVKLVDLRIGEEPRIQEVMRSFKPDIVGTGGCTLDAVSVLKLCREAKEASSNVLTVVGGHHASIMPDYFFVPEVDVVVAGEGVWPFKALCRCVQEKKGFDQVDNIHFRKNGSWTFTGKTAFPGLDHLPFPDRSLTSHVRHRYIWPVGSEIKPFASVLSSVGCIYNCKFCSTPRLYNRKIFNRRIDRILEELHTVEDEFIFWADDEILLDPKRTVELAKAIGAAGIEKGHFYSARSNTIVSHPECVEEWAKIGLELAFIGVESHRDKELRSMRKGTSQNKNEEAVRICHANNVKVRGNFMVRPEYDEEDFKSLIQYVKKLNVDFPNFTIYTPLPGTDLYDEEKDNLLTDDFCLFDVYHAVLPTKLPLKEFYNQFVRLFVESSSRDMMDQIDPELRKLIFSNNYSLLQKLMEAYKHHRQ
jgi:radical SAM superfamily enzyme YgiQ (UPF0313 family)